MATQDALDLNSRGMHTAPYGDAVVHEGSIVPLAAGAADIWRMVRIPAGTRVEQVKIIADQIDSNGAPTLTAKVGFTPVNAGDGPAANDAYWQAAVARFRAAESVDMIAHPITFEFDVWLIITLGGAAATFVAAKRVTALVTARPIGTK